jgi:deoxyadenosine/deoxycytidine kinase
LFSIFIPGVALCIGDFFKTRTTMIAENENVVVIVGPPAAGKTHLSKELEKNFPDYRFFHTDDYMKHGYLKSMYVLMEDVLASDNKKMVIEGVQTPRLLRKGVELNNFYPDLIIRVDADIEKKLARYKERNLEYPHAMAKNIETVYNEYANMMAAMRGQRKIPRTEYWKS